MSALRTIRTRSWLSLFVAVTFLETLLLAVLASRYSINADEGFYLRAGQQVLNGRRVYADFFFPQMPYLPFVEAVAMAFTGPSLYACRAISVVTGGLLAGMLALVAARVTGDRRSGVAVALAYGAHSVLLASLPIVKTYGIANLTMMGAILLVTPAPVSLIRGFAAGVCAGAAVGVRLPVFAAVVPLFGWLALRHRRSALAFAAGVVLSSLPWLWIAAQDPGAFWFGNFGFHTLRREITGFGPIAAQKAQVLVKWVLWPQDLVLWMIAGASAWRFPRQSFPALACVGGLSAAYLAATPTYFEYMTQIVPLLLLASVPMLPWLLRHRRAAVTAAVLYLGGLAATLRVDAGIGVSGTPQAAKLWVWHQGVVLPVAAYLREHSEPGDRILSWWEGYPFLAGRAGFDGVGFWESNVAEKVLPAARRRYHLRGREDIEQLVRSGEPRFVVFPQGVWQRLDGALATHYRLATRLWTIQIFERRNDAEPSGSAPGRKTGEPHSSIASTVGLPRGEYVARLSSSSVFSRPS